jgi:hypothetical protein
MSESDDMKLVMLPGVVLGSSESPVQVDIEFTAPVGNNPNSIGFTLESSVSFSQGIQRIQFFDKLRQEYTTMDVRPVGMTDRSTLISINSMHPYLENRKFRARIMFKPTGPSLGFPWQARIDLARLRLPGGQIK